MPVANGKLNAGSDVPSLQGKAPIIEVRIRTPGSRNQVLLLILIGLIIVLSVLAFLSLVAARLIAGASLAAFSVAIALILLWIHYARKRADERMGKAAIYDVGSSTSAEAILRAVESAIFWDVDSTSARVQDTVRDLAAKGVKEETVRLFWSKQVFGFEPILESFDPKILDETSPAFEEFRSAFDEKWPDRDKTESKLSWKIDATWRVIRRNFELRSRSVGFWIIIFWLVMSAQEAYQGRRITFKFGLYGACAALVFAALLRPAGLARRQWYIVPGGLLLRTASGSNARLRLYRRKGSLLALFQRGRRSWSLAVADADSSDGTLITSSEMEMLLRAWLSPLDPPPVESLVDYQ